jgi:nitrite reductase (NO-forming)
MRRTFWPLILVLTTLLSGCASAPAVASFGTPVATTGGGAQQLTVQSLDAMRFEPNTITVKAGQPVELTLTNAGSLDHDFALTEGVAEPIKILARGGESATATFTLDQPGTYAFTCSQAGHAGAGMKGTITAQ